MWSLIHDSKRKKTRRLRRAIEAACAGNSLKFRSPVLSSTIISAAASTTRLPRPLVSNSCMPARKFSAPRTLPWTRRRKVCRSGATGGRSRFSLPEAAKIRVENCATISAGGKNVRGSDLIKSWHAGHSDFSSEYANSSPLGTVPAEFTLMNRVAIGSSAATSAPDFVEREISSAGTTKAGILYDFALSRRLNPSRSAFKCADVASPQSRSLRVVRCIAVRDPSCARFSGSRILATLSYMNWRGSDLFKAWKRKQAGTGAFASKGMAVGGRLPAPRLAASLTCSNSQAASRRFFALNGERVFDR